MATKITLAQARAMRRIIEANSVRATDEEAVAAPFIFPRWDGNGTEYAAGDRVQYEGKPYRCLQAHTSQAGWNPADAPSLWAQVLIPDPEVIPDWVQPGSTNPYMKGDKVKHVGKVWESLIDGNVWEPGSVGTETLWAQVTA